MNENNEFFGHKHDLYSNLVNILKSTNELLANPKIPEGMVTREELALSLSKIVPGISEDELAKILKNYSTQNEVELRLVNYVLKSDFENRLSAFVAKADAAKYVTSEQAQEFSKKTDVIEAFSKYYDRQVIDTLVKNLPSRDEIDLKLQGYLLKSDYKQFDGYTREEMDKILRNTIDYDKLYVELKKYLSLQGADAVLENYTRKDQADAKYLSKAVAEETYAKKGEYQKPDLTGLASEEFVKNAINQAKLDGNQQVDLTIYDTKEGVKAKITEAKAEIGTSVDSKINKSKGELLTVIDSKADANAIANVYAKKSEIPTTNNLATKIEVEQKISESKSNIVNVIDQKVSDLAGKTPSFTQVGNNRIIRLNNGDSISAFKASGGESANLIRLSADDKIELGSTAVNVNFNGFNARPTYNNKELALNEDLARVETNVNAKVANKLDRNAVEVNLSGVSGIVPDSKAVASYVSQEIAKAKLEGKEVDLSAFAPKTYVDEKLAINKAELIAGLDTKVDGAITNAKIEINAKLDNKIDKNLVEEKYVSKDQMPDHNQFATKEDLKLATGNALTLADANKLYAAKDEIPDITGLAEKAVVEQKLDKAEAENTYAKLASVPSQEVLNNKLNIADADAKYATKEENKLNITKEEAEQKFATQNWVTDKINQAALGGGEGGTGVDLSAYELKSSSDTKIANVKSELEISIATKLSEDQANEKYVKKDELPDTTNLATKEEVAKKLSQDEADAIYLKLENSTNLVTKDELNQKVGQDSIDTVKAELEAKIAELTKKLDELTARVVEQHPKTDTETELIVDENSWTDGKVDDIKTLTFTSNANNIALSVKADADTDIVEYSVQDKVATITAKKAGTTTLIASATAADTIDKHYTEKTIEISITIADKDPVDPQQ